MMRRDKNLKKPQELDPNNVTLFARKLVEPDLSRSVLMLPGREYEVNSKARSDSPDAHFLGSEGLAEEGKWDGVEGELRQTLELYPNRPDARDLLGTSLISRRTNFRRR